MAGLSRENRTTLGEPAHPLDPLTAGEITRAVAAVRALPGFAPRAWFETVTLAEPDKAAARAGTAPRLAYVCVFDPERLATARATVDLASGRVLGFDEAAGAMARITADEFLATGDWVARHPDFVAALRRRGITDPSLVLVEPWAAGHFGHAEEEGRRLAYTHAWVRAAPDDNPYAKPIDGLHALVDLTTGEILRIDDRPDHAPFGSESANFAPGTAGPLRRDLRPLEIVQPQGPSFAVEGHAVRWLDWRFRIGWSPREGLILYDVAWQDGDRLRPIAWRLALSEMVVPYGAPDAGDARRNAFDLGEYGIGQLTDSLALGCDCLGQIHYFDMTVHDWHGVPKVIERAVCLHEEDDGILFKHWHGRTPDVRRGRRLVVSFLATIGNYVYGIYWSFRPDGAVACEVKATGIVFTSGHRPGEPVPWGTVVAPNVQAHVHQHVFNFRLDLDIDGERNRVLEIDHAPVPMGPGNPFGNAIGRRETVLATEIAARRKVELASARRWRIVNRERRNRFGEPVGYELVPGANALPFAHVDSPIGRRAGFMYHHLWVTPFEPDELHAAGWFPNQHRGGDGLPAWTARDRPLEDRDLVLWYTMNLHHLPRPEDFPVQPVVRIGFELLPFGFFDRNPALGMPPATTACCD